MARVADPVGGAYIVEELTSALVNELAKSHKPQASSSSASQLVASGLPLEAGIPNREELLWPTLTALRELGGSGGIGEINDTVIPLGE